jgi:hypothetical protein
MGRKHTKGSCFSIHGAYPRVVASFPSNRLEADQRIVWAPPGRARLRPIHAKGRRCRTIRCTQWAICPDDQLLGALSLYPPSMVRMKP